MKCGQIKITSVCEKETDRQNQIYNLMEKQNQCYHSVNVVTFDKAQVMTLSGFHCINVPTNQQGT